MTEWRWDVCEDENGNVNKIDFTGDKLGDDKILFDAIAPFVDEGSFIKIIGENNFVWTWFFNEKICDEQYP
jgi:hypothetical protein